MLSLLSLVFWALQLAWIPHWQITWAITTYIKQQTPDAADAASLLTYSAACKPFSYVSLNWIISVWVQPNATWSHSYSLTAEYHLLQQSRTVWSLQWFRFYKKDPRFIVKTKLPEPLLSSWDCVFCYRIQYYLSSNSVRKHWEYLVSQSADLHTHTSNDDRFFGAE